MAAPAAAAAAAAPLIALTAANIDAFVRAIPAQILALRGQGLILTQREIAKASNLCRSSLLLLAALDGAAAGALPNWAANGFTRETILEHVILKTVHEFKNSTSEAEADIQGLKQLLLDPKNGDSDPSKLPKVYLQVENSIAQAQKEIVLSITAVHAPVQALVGANAAPVAGAAPAAAEGPIVGSTVSFNFHAALTNAGSLLASTFVNVGPQLAGAMEGIKGVLPAAINPRVRDTCAAILISSLVTLSYKESRNSSETAFVTSFYGTAAAPGFLRKVGQLDPATGEVYNLEDDFVRHPRYRTFFYNLFGIVMYARLSVSDFETTHVIDLEESSPTALCAEIATFMFETMLFYEGVRDQKVIARQLFRKANHTYIEEGLGLIPGKDRKTDLNSRVFAFIQESIHSPDSSRDLIAKLGQTNISTTYFESGVLRAQFPDEKAVIHNLRSEVGRLTNQVQVLQQQQARNVAPAAAAPPQGPNPPPNSANHHNNAPPQNNTNNGPSRNNNSNHHYDNNNHDNNHNHYNRNNNNRRSDRP